MALVETGAPAAEVAAALGPNERRALPIVVAAILRELAPLDQDDPDIGEKDQMLAGEVMRASVLLSPHLDPRQRADWVSGVTAEFDREPFELVLEGIAYARRVCKHPADFVPTVIGFVIPRKARLEALRERYETMMEAAR